ncbi:MAG TPA: isoprenylcysteine carboxylmethyltransferase family protein [Sedimenticola sp.]|nr:isoprenylcysteine carboxylmethyltransferase family protein [Sedimenticola sp.]
MKSPLSASVWLRIIVWSIFLVGGLLLSLYLDRVLFPEHSVSPFRHLISGVIGAWLLWLVLRIARNTGRTLAHFGRKGTLPRLETNRLVTAGPYGCMRHPMHLGLMLFPLAVALLAGSPAFIFIVAPLEAAIMAMLVLTLEEREAIHKFGAAYLDYRRQVPAFTLRPACLRQLLGPAPGSANHPD